MASLFRRRISLLSRVYVLVAVLLVLLAIVSVGTAVFRHRNEAVSTRLTTEIIPARIAASQLTAAYSDQANAVQKFLTTGDLASFGAYESGTDEVAHAEDIITQQLAGSPRVMSSLDDVRQRARVWRQDSVAPMTEKVRSQGPAALSPAETRTSHQRFTVLRAELGTLRKHINEIAASQTAGAAATRAAANWLTWSAVAASVVVAVGVLFLLRRWLTHPLRTLVFQVNQVAEGHLDRPVEMAGPPELGTVTRAVETMRRRILDETARGERMQRDLARREAAERRRAEQDYATVVAALDEGVLVIGEAGGVEAANRAAQRILGASESEIIRDFPPESWPLFDEAGRALRLGAHPAERTRRTGQPCNAHVLRLRRADGSDVWLSVTSRALSPPERPPYKVVVSFTDITEQRNT